MKIKPSKKEKRRYFVIDRHDIERALTFINQIPEANPHIVLEERGKVMLKVSRKSAEKVKVLLKEKNIKCYGISGTIKKARRFL